ncbi:MAG: hypothetical protein F9K27_15520 [Anaerolineae bacterium]|nr:MAG: hypothetical protein F9K27_15520 [Anaerolineae bacterium]
MNAPTQVPLGAYLKQILDERSISGNMLAKSAGIAEGSVRNLLRYGVDGNAPMPQPQTLTLVSQFLGLDTIEIFQMAGYFPPAPRESTISPRAEYVAMRFDRLSPDQQRMVMDLIISMEKTSGKETLDEHIQSLLEEVYVLRREHPMFEKRYFSLLGEMGRRIGKWTHTTTSAILMHGILSRLHEFTDDPVLLGVNEKRVQEILGHPDAVVILNQLLPRTDIPKPLEKLYWLVNPDGMLDKTIDKLSNEQQQGIQALWHLLDRIVPPAKTGSR